jgi:hypothetical protein
MNAPKGRAPLLGFFLLFSAALVQAEEPFTDSMEKAFVDNGKISIKLTAGLHRIARSDDDHIRISWRVDDEDIDDVETTIHVDGSSAKINIDGPRENFRTVIEVPGRSNLVVRLSAGELDIEHIEGSKDIELRAGELSIDVGDTDEYAQVKGSLWAGEIDAGPFNQEKSGLFRSVKWTGEGSHQLRFKLYAGEVTLFQARN